MIIVDSSGWIEFLQGTQRAHLFAPALRELAGVVVPGISVFEVHRLIASKLGSEAAAAAVCAMKKACVANLDADLAVRASSLASLHHLALADAIIYATADAHEAELWTQDAHFKDLPGVKYFPKP
jgi:predicted nucleic acid-binding protein